MYLSFLVYVLVCAGAQAVVHLGMHGTVEWLPGQPLGNDRRSWSDELVGLPNVYVYAANNPSESILAKRRGYGTIISYNVPPYGRAGLYLELANLKELVDEYRTESTREGVNEDLCQTIYDLAQRSGMTNDVPLLLDPNDKESALEGPDLPKSVFEEEGHFCVVGASSFGLPQHSARSLVLFGFKVRGALSFGAHGREPIAY